MILSLFVEPEGSSRPSASLPHALAHAELKAAYGRTLQQSLLLSTGVLLLVFLLSPQIRFTPYAPPAPLPIQLQRIEPDRLAPPPVELPDVPIDAIGPMDFAEPEAPALPDLQITSDLDEWTEIPLPPLGAPPGVDRFTRFRPLEPTLPRIRAQKAPTYPEMAREIGVEGVVLVEVKINNQGYVVETRLVNRVHPLLDSEALNAVVHWRFEPAQQGDVKVPVWIMLPFEFRLR